MARVSLAVLFSPVMLLLAVVSPAQQPENLLSNPAFEQGAEGWQTLGLSRYTVVDGEGTAGSRCLRYTKPDIPETEPRENSHFDQTVTVEPDTLYVAGARFKSEGNLRPALRIASMDWATLAMSVMPEGEGWQEARVLFDAAGNSQVRFQVFSGSLTIRRESAPGTSYCDDAYLRKLSPDETAELGIARIEVDASKTVREINPLFFGTNLLFVSDDDAALADGVIQQRLKELPCRLLRYPGGEMADNYNWKTQELEYPQIFPRRGGPETTSTDEFIPFCRGVGAEPIFVANLESFAKKGDIAAGAALAAEWVAYCRDKGFPVTRWEVGNETYLSGGLDPLTARQYAEGLVAYSRAMKAVDPAIKIGAVGPFGASWIGGMDREKNTGEAWWPTVAEIAGEHFDFMVVHRYGPPLDNLAGGIASLRGWYSETFPGKTPVVSLTEWNSLQQSGELGQTHGLSIAQLCYQYLLGGVDLGCFWPLRHTGERWDTLSLLDKDDHAPLGAYRAMQLLSTHIGDRLIECECPNAYVSAFASTGRGDGRSSVFIINRARKGEVSQARVTIGGVRAGKASALTLCAGEADAQPGEAKPVNVSQTDEGWECELPPFSLTVIDFE